MADSRIPKYRRHANGQAFVQHKSIPSKDHRMYLGQYGSERSWQRYNRFVERLLAAEPTIELGSRREWSVNELISAYLEFAEGYYSEDGKPTKEFGNMVYALRPVAELFGDENSEDFGPRAVVTIQEHLVRKEYSRTVINRRIGMIKRFVRWCCKNEYLDPTRYHALQSVDGLRRGRSDAKEPKPIEPVRVEHVDALLPYLPPEIRAMVRTQMICGMRPGEVCIMRRCDIVMDDEIWLYKPHKHKGQWRENSLVKAIPKAAQELIQPFFKADIEAYLFRPQDAHQWCREHWKKHYKPERKTPRYPSEALRVERNKEAARRRTPKRRQHPHYTTETYRRAIEYGFKRAERAGVSVPRWHPMQLRHSIATRVSQALGQQKAQRWLGHTNLKTTDIYVEREVSELIEIAHHVDRLLAS